MGISLVTATLARMAVVDHEELASRLAADAPQVRSQMPERLTGSPVAAAQAEGLAGQQAAMIAYADNFLLMLAFTLAVLPIVLMLRKPMAAGSGRSGAAVLAD